MEDAVTAASESTGRIIAATDDEILAAQKLLAASGIWVEPASAAGLAGLIKEVDAGNLELSGRKVAIVCTGHGLKDPDIITAQFTKPQVVKSELGALEKIILHD